MYEINWASSEFEAAPIGDGRIINRLVKTTELLFQHPNSSIPEACGGWAETKGTYRLLDNDNLTHEAIITGHKLQTIERMRKYDVVLCIQDTTTFDFSHHPNTKGLGLYSEGKDRYGLLMHSTLAVTPEGVPLGLLSQDIWTRNPDERGKKYNRYKLSTQEKESQKWIKALDSSLQGVHKGTMTVTVCDRESDVYDFFNAAMSRGRHFLIRVAQDRSVVGEHNHLVAEVESKQCSGEILTAVPRNTENNLPQRDIRLSIKFCPVTVMPPKNRSDSKTLPNLKLYAVLAEEIDPPKDTKPIYWLLLTTLPVQTLEDAVEKIKWYKQRWKIERYHLTLKSGCKVEGLQLENAKRLQNAIGIYSIIAWKLLWLMYESRDNPEAPCDIVLKKTNGKHFAV